MYYEEDILASPVSESYGKHKQLTCRCKAYKFPHRWMGGKCTGIAFVNWYWFSRNEGRAECENCGSNNEFECHVITGQEDVHQCQAIRVVKRFYR